MRPVAPASTLSDDNKLTKAFAMLTSFAAGTLIVLGVLITVLGFLGGGHMAWVGIGLAAIFGGGVLSLVERKVAR
jgi:hypothetical protein